MFCFGSEGYDLKINQHRLVADVKNDSKVDEQEPLKSHMVGDRITNKCSAGCSLGQQP